ncbi:protocadherin Fat 4-like Cad96Ca isoform X2 [Oratosquilla oratoria]|uniref:protocadherin Fat 4-like Cad96Ca isoform X2 n=1 Tax=Oratosquilla oratoria TaxID=337810 RepID=UPI003F760019
MAGVQDLPNKCARLEIPDDVTSSASDVTSGKQGHVVCRSRKNLHNQILSQRMNRTYLEYGAKRTERKMTRFNVIIGYRDLVKCWSKPRYWWTNQLVQNVVLVWALLQLISSVNAQDSRCYLAQGGSVENFFVKESLPVGSVIGTLQLEGDASEAGDIYLRLKERNSPVQISDNSKNLTLTGKLDKEGKDGPSHVVVNVICDRRGTTDPSFTIPVNIRVTDDNDNAPVFVNEPYFVNVSEVTVVGTIILSNIEARDEDQQGPFSTVHYSIAQGPHSDMFAFESPMRGSLLLRKPLDFERDSLFNITIIAQDQGTPPRSTSSVVTVAVTDADDQNPVFTRDRYMAVLPEHPAKDAVVHVQPEDVHAEDRDVGIMAVVTYSFSREVSEADWFNIDPESGQVSLARDLPEDQLTQPVTLVVRATQRDNPDRYAVTTLTVSRRGVYSKQLQFLQREYVATVLENLPLNSLVAPTVVNKNVDKNVRFRLENDEAQKFRVSPTGQVLLDKALDFEAQQEYNLRIVVTDGVFSDTATLRVTVLNVNDWDPRFRYPQYEFFVSGPKLTNGDSVGSVEVADGDRGDVISFSLGGQDARAFTVTSKGELLIRDVTRLNTTEAHIVVVAKDSGVPPRQASVPVTVRFPAGLVRSSPLTASSSFLLMVIFGALLGVFVFVIICLAIYIHKNKKYRDDHNAALPTKMSQIVSPNGIPHTKLDSLSSLNHQMQGNGRPSISSPVPNGVVNGVANGIPNGVPNGSVPNGSVPNGNIPNGVANGIPNGVSSSMTSVETPCYDSATENNNNVSSNNNNIRGSMISVRSSARSTNSAQGSQRYLRNPLANGGTLSSEDKGPPHNTPVPPSPSGTVTSFITNASAATVPATDTQHSQSRSGTPTATSNNHRPRGPTLVTNGIAASPSPSRISIVSRSTTVDGTARAPGGLPSNKVAPVPPPSPTSTLGAPTPQPPPGTMPPSRVMWPNGSIPKKVKKLSWEDELSSTTELDPEVSVTPMPQKPASTETPNLTVYF